MPLDLPALVRQRALSQGEVGRAWLDCSAARTRLGRIGDAARTARRQPRRAANAGSERAAAFDPDRAVLVHGDAHGWNALDAGPEAVWQWGFIERVSTGLANRRDFDAEGASAFFEVAERCC